MSHSARGGDSGTAARLDVTKGALRGQGVQYLEKRYFSYPRSKDLRYFSYPRSKDGERRQANDRAYFQGVDYNYSYADCRPMLSAQSVYCTETAKAFVTQFVLRCTAFEDARWGGEAQLVLSGVDAAEPSR